MSHEIDSTTGSAAVFTAGQLPWHGLGRNVTQAVDSRQAITLAGLDWRVGQWPIHAAAPDGWGMVNAKGFVATVREDTKAVLGVVSKRYQPFQNAEAFAFADAIVGEGQARYETAGSLRGGRRVWMLLRLPEEVRVGRGDEIHPYLLLANTFDGSGSLRALLTSVRVVCANTLNLALGTAGRAEGVSIKHRGDLQSRVEAARRTLGLVHRRLRAFSEEVEHLRATPMTAARLERYFDSLLPDADTDAEKRNRDKVLEQLNRNFEDDLNSLAGMRGSAWAAFNAVSEYADHQRKFRGGSPAARAESRLESTWFGSSAELTSAAYRAALQVAGLN